MATYALSQTLSTPAGSLTASVSASGGAEVVLSNEAVTAGTDTEVEIAVPFANIKAIWMHSTTAATIETNNGTTPSDTISLAAGVPNTWITGGAGSNPLSADVTSIFVTNVADTVLNIRVLYDATP